MDRRGSATDRSGRIWTVTVLSRDDAEAEDARFWYDVLTPSERVEAVADCLLSSLKAQGIDEIPDYEEFLESLNAHGVRYAS